MDSETLQNMDMRADDLLRSWASDPVPDRSDAGDCIVKMGKDLNKVYLTSPLPLDLLSGYGVQFGGWVLDQAKGMAFDYIIMYGGKKLIKIYHDHAAGKAAPAPKEFRILLEGGVYAVTRAKGKLNVKHKDGSVDSR